MLSSGLLYTEREALERLGEEQRPLLCGEPSREIVHCDGCGRLALLSDRGGVWAAVYELLPDGRRVPICDSCQGL